MPSFFRRTVLAAIGVLFATLASAQDRAKVVAVNYPLQYFADRLLDGSADVIFPVPQDTDPSFWRPAVADISLVQSADLILLNGAGFAAWVDRVSLPRSRLVNTSRDIKDRYVVTESITHSHGDGGEHSHEGLASYLWLDPTLAASQAEATARALASRGLATTEGLDARLTELKADLAALDAQAQSALADAQGVAMIATHPRYQYLARRYGLSITALEWEAGAAPTADQLVELRSLIDQTGAQVLIWEAEPPAEALQAAVDMGLRNVTFPTLVHQPGDGDFMTTYGNAVSDLAAAVAN